MLSKKPIPEADDKRLSQLLRIKRQERPDDAFWDKFDEEMRSKQLAALVRTQSLYERLGKLSLLVARKSATATATASVFAIGIFAVSKTEFFAGNTQDDLIQNPAVEQTAVATPLTHSLPMFVVEESAPQLNVPDATFAPVIDAKPFYEVNVMTKNSAPVSYQIIAETKEFTAGQSSTETGLGAMVIRTGTQF